MYSRKWQDVVDVANPLLKNLGGFTDMATNVCDMVSSNMYTDYPWKDTITTIARNTLPLINYKQDLSSPINLYRLTKATLLRTDVFPNWTRELDIVNDCAVNLTPRSPDAIRCCSQQQATGTIRLESAAAIASGVLVQLVGEYQLNPIKIISLGQELWFKDQYFSVAVEGILYWGYKLSDDVRAGNVQISRGVSVATGQMAIYGAALQKMKKDEDFPAENSLFPAESMGDSWNYDGLNIFGF